MWFWSSDKWYLHRPESISRADAWACRSKAACPRISLPCTCRPTFLCDSPGRNRSPIGEIHVPPSAVHVVDDEPGNGSHVAVPGPHGAVGMAIVARPVEDAGHRWIHRQARSDFARWVNRRICSGRPDHLNHHEKQKPAKEYSPGPLCHSVPFQKKPAICPLRRPIFYTASGKAR